MEASVAILAGARTPFGKLGGALAPLSATDLGAAVIREAMVRSRLCPEEVDHAIMGLVLGAGVGQVPSRQATLMAGLPLSVTSETVNKVCASGLRAVAMADEMIRSGNARSVVAGGMESMSNAPFLLEQARFGYRMGDGVLVDAMFRDGLFDPVHRVAMGVHNAYFSEEFGVSREDQDSWALRSHQRAIAAQDAGRLADEIVSVEVPRKRGGGTRVERDEGPRRETSLKALEALKPIFGDNGTTTAGNSPGVNDGAAALVLASDQLASKRGLRPLARLLSWASVADEPRNIAAVPAPAARKALARIGMQPADVDLWEINEAFATVAVHSVRTLDIDPDRVNVNGGAVAFGHPIGATGARLLLTLVHELGRRGGGIGVAAICSGLAQGDAVVVQV